MPTPQISSLAAWSPQNRLFISWRNTWHTCCMFQPSSCGCRDSMSSVWLESFRIEIPTFNVWCLAQGHFSMPTAGGQWLNPRLFVWRMTVLPLEPKQQSVSTIPESFKITKQKCSSGSVFLPPCFPPSQKCPQMLVSNEAKYRKIACIPTRGKWSIESLYTEQICNISLDLIHSDWVRSDQSLPSDPVFQWDSTMCYRCMSYIYKLLTFVCISVCCCLMD